MACRELRNPHRDTGRPAWVRTIIVTGYAETDVLARLRSLIHAATPLVAENWPLIPTAALIAGHGVRWP